MMKLMTLILTVILTVALPLAQAQDTSFHRSWDCLTPIDGNPTTQYRCYSLCADLGTDLRFDGDPLTFVCTQSHIPPGFEFASHTCSDYANALIPIQCVRPSSGQSSSSNSTNKALIAGGVVVAGVALWNFLQPEIPVEGLEIQPKANFAYRDGFPSSSVSLQGEYGNWAFSASSVHTGKQWTKPYARAQWAWVF